MAEAQANQQPKKSDLVKVRVKSGRILITDPDHKGPGRAGTTDLYAEAGEVIDMPRAQAEKLAGRSFDGYPSQDGTPGKFPGLVKDAPIEIISQ